MSKFDLSKFLVENKLTQLGRLTENEFDGYEEEEDEMILEPDPEDLYGDVSVSHGERPPYKPLGTETAVDEKVVEPGVDEADDFSKYESVEDLMKEIERSTNEAALKHKMERVRKAYESIEAKATSLEEGEHAKYLAPGKVKEMRRSSKELRKMHERLLKEYEKKFPVKKKSELNEVAEEGGQVIEKNLQDLTWNDMELAFPGLGKEQNNYWKNIKIINLPIPTLRGEMLTIHSEARFNEWKEHMLKVAGNVKVTLDESQKWFDQVKLDADMEDLFGKKA